MAANEHSKIYELVLNGPGMGDEFKLTLQVSKKHLVLICLLIEDGVQPGKGKVEEFVGLITKETAAELLQLIPEILKKGGPGMPEFYEKIKSL